MCRALVSLSIFVLLIAAFCSGFPSTSQAKTGVKSDIVGHWAAPDCARVDEAVTFTRHFYLKSAQDSLELQRYTPAGTGKDHLILSIGGLHRPVIRLEDGVLRTGDYAEAPEKNAPFEDINFLWVQDFTNCPDVPAVIPKPLQRLTRYLDRIDEACAVTGGASTAVPKNLSQDCARVLFKAADIDGDNKVTALEIKRGIISAALLAKLAGGTPLEGKAIEDAAAEAKTLADTIAEKALAAQDTDGNAALDYNESVENFTAPKDAPGLKDMLAQIGQLFPSFKLASLGL